ncbi:hypothetical protein [Chryseobacterium indoltheticum]|uniref:Uncharacterized protein n=1 Tax=Chryseobacterium indoltheticum TaxID=254 RepID=A0A381FDG4_9FLAO|nr:hypothetical protein [Chryseobacterium indoltheticum]SUX44523.1 Uncharacterised protein [Chryseobacterium indoltheticum]
MKTSEQFSFLKLENEVLESAIKQVNQDYNVIQIFYNKSVHSQDSHLIINLEHQKDIDKLKQKHWIKKAYYEHKVHIHLFYNTQLHHKFDSGHPYVEYYCKPSALIYQNEHYGNHLLIDRNWKKFNKKFENYKEIFYHDHNLLLSQTREFIKDKSFVSVFLSYEKVIRYDLEYLENLYTGSSSDTKNLHQRIYNLVPYTPEIQKYFVKQNGKKYYLISLFDKARRSAREDELMYENEFFEAIGIAEESLFSMIEIRLDQLKKQIKKSPRHIVTPFEIPDVLADNNDKIVDKAVKIIIKLENTEEIYLFHKATYGNNITYYLLIIAHNVSNEKLKETQYYLKSKAGKQYDFVLISHDRNWIQQHLFKYQNFFAKIIQGKNRIYASSPYHPEPHWESPHHLHQDLDSYYKSAKGNGLQFLSMVGNENDNHQGIPFLFALFFLSFCRTYIFVKLCYMPNYLSFQSLWQLCLYANPDMIRYQHLYDGFLLKLIPTLEYHKFLRHKFTCLDKEVIDHMKVIVEKLMNDLDELVKEEGLIDKTEKDGTIE